MTLQPGWTPFFRMARQPRFRTPGSPQHIIQRGNNKAQMFGSTTDYLVFLSCLLEAIERFDCAIHAYVLMTNHVHLLMSPANANGISRVMQSVGRRYVRYFNDRYQRTGTLWEGRYRATVVDTEHYLLACYRYIEENPLRAGMVRELSDYRWSSFGFNALGRDDPLITPHQGYLALAPSPASRRMVYRALFRTPNEPSLLAAIRAATNHAWALGSEAFLSEISRLGRRAAPLPSGPPPAKVRGQTPNRGFGV